MGSDSNLSWCTADDDITKFAISKSKINHLNEITCDSSIENYIELLPIYDQSKSTENSEKRSNIQNHVKTAKQLKDLYTWKVPWILIIFSIIQVNQTMC